MILPRTVEIEEMDARSKEWAVSGYVVFKDNERDTAAWCTVGVSRDMSHGWERFYVRRHEFWLDMREIQLAALRRQIYLGLQSDDYKECFLARWLDEHWGKVLFDVAGSGGVLPYEKLGDVYSNALHKDTEHRVHSQVSTQLSNLRAKVARDSR